MDARVLSWCKRLIGCRSVTGEGTRAIAEMCARDLLDLIKPLDSHGIEVRLIPSVREGKEQTNLIATIKGHDANATPLVLNTHLDTVPPGDAAAWTETGGDPFTATIRDDRIYGLGAADTKLDFVAKVMALAGCGTPRRDVYLVGTFGEEHGLVGAKEVAAAGLLPRGALAYIGEPSRLQVITAHKGLMVFELTVRFEPERREARAGARLIFAGRAAHSSTPALGRNAITDALAVLVANPRIYVASISGGDAVNKVPARCEAVVSCDFAGIGGVTSVETGETVSTTGIPHSAIRALADFIGELKKFADHSSVAEPDYAAPTLTCNPGVIRGSADSLTLEFELRPPPSLGLEAVRTGVAAIVEAQNSASARSGRSDVTTISQVTLEVNERRANPGFRSALDSETVELAMAALARAGLPLEIGVKAGWTEAGIYAAAGVRPVVFGPGPSTGVIHAPNEHNFLSDVSGAIDFYRQLLKL